MMSEWERQVHGQVGKVNKGSFPLNQATNITVRLEKLIWIYVRSYVLVRKLYVFK